MKPVLPKDCDLDFGRLWPSQPVRKWLWEGRGEDFVDGSSLIDRSFDAAVDHFRTNSLRSREGLAVAVRDLKFRVHYQVREDDASSDPTSYVVDLAILKEGEDFDAWHAETFQWKYVKSEPEMAIV